MRRCLEYLGGIVKWWEYKIVDAEDQGEGELSWGEREGGHW